LPNKNEKIKQTNKQTKKNKKKQAYKGAQFDPVRIAIDHWEKLNAKTFVNIHTKGQWTTSLT
jgi:hypothetical protein